MNDPLENLLKHPQLWQAGRHASGISPGLPTGYPRLDCQLPGGGWPRHALCEILLEQYGTGELQLVMPALAGLSQPAGEGDGADTAGWIAWIAPPFQPYAPALRQWGIDLTRMLIVRPRVDKEILWAAEQALASGNCKAVLVWPPVLDHTTSRRLQLAAGKGRCLAFAFRPWHALLEPSAAPLRLRLEAGEKGTDIGILKSRGGRPTIVRNYAE